MRYLFSSVLCAALLVGCCASSVAQAIAPKPLGQTDIAASFFGNFPSSSSNARAIQNPAHAAGWLLEMRHISNPLVGYELNLSGNGADQHYSEDMGYLQTVKAHAHEVGADWVVSMPIGSLRPFADAGLGLIFFRASGDQPLADNKTKPAFQYAAGADWNFIPHFGLRFQFRGSLYHAPAMARPVVDTHSMIESAQPTIGAFYYF